MKNLVLGALVSALSFSAFATGSLHVKSTQIGVWVSSQGTELTIVPCPTAERVIPSTNPASVFGINSFAPAVSLDGNQVIDYSMAGTNNSYDIFYGTEVTASLNSLHYGESFSMCVRMKLEGGYTFLRGTHHMVLGAAFGVSPDSGTYVADSGLQASVDVSCKKPYSFLDWSVTGIQNMVPAFPVADQVRVEKDLSGTGLPSFCDARITFTETSSLQRAKASDNVFIYIDLDAAIN